MLEIAQRVRRAIWRRATIPVTVLAVCVPLSSALAAGPVSSAVADDEFCTNVLLQPYGQTGDRCYEGLDKGNWYLSVVYVYTEDRAGCVTYAGYYGELYHSWECVGAHSGKQLYVSPDGGWYRGVIRNNNLSYAARFRGKSSCCWQH